MAFCNSIRSSALGKWKNKSQKERGILIYKQTSLVLVVITLISISVSTVASKHLSQQPRIHHRRYTSGIRTAQLAQNGVYGDYVSSYAGFSRPVIQKKVLTGPHVCGTKCCEGWQRGHSAMCITAICNPKCENGGRCIEPDKCFCVAPYEGNYCQTKIEKNVVLHNLQSKRKRDPRQTVVHVRYDEPRRQHTEVVCTSTTCFNGGTCVDGSCICPKGYMGRRCEKVIVIRTSLNSVLPGEITQQATSVPVARKLCNALCIHGTCRGGSRPICRCYPGYYGTMCDSRASSITRKVVSTAPESALPGLKYSNNFLRPIVTYSNHQSRRIPTVQHISSSLSTRHPKFGKCYKSFGGDVCGLSFNAIMSLETCCDEGLGDGWGWGEDCYHCRTETNNNRVPTRVETKYPIRKSCPQGYRIMNGDCYDINECQLGSNLCRNGKCNNIRGSYWCQCKRGYHQHVSRRLCLPDRVGFRTEIGETLAKCYISLDVRGRCSKSVASLEGYKAACCCSVGVAWGSRCEKCPKKTSAEYRRLCPNGSGYFKYRHRTVPMRQYVNMIPRRMPTAGYVSAETITPANTFRPTTTQKSTTFTTTSTTTPPPSKSTRADHQEVTQGEREETITMKDEGDSMLQNTEQTTATADTEMVTGPILPRVGTDYGNTTSPHGTVKPTESATTDQINVIATITAVAKESHAFPSTSVPENISRYELSSKELPSKAETTVIAKTPTNEVKQLPLQTLKEVSAHDKSKLNHVYTTTTVLNSTTTPEVADTEVIRDIFKHISQHTVRTTTKTVDTSADLKRPVIHPIVLSTASTEQKRESICEPNPCVRGTCLEDIDGFSCDCEPGFRGDVCDQVIQPDVLSPASTEQTTKILDDRKMGENEKQPVIPPIVLPPSSVEHISKNLDNEEARENVEDSFVIDQYDVSDDNIGIEESLYSDVEDEDIFDEEFIDGELENVTRPLAEIFKPSVGPESVQIEFNTSQDVLARPGKNEKELGGETPSPTGSVVDLPTTTMPESTPLVKKAVTEISTLANIATEDLNDLTPCSCNPCENGGECTNDDDSSFKCHCTEGFFGLKCETKDYCVPDPCKNGATCEAGIGFYYCDCPAGFTGKHCETRESECESNPCVRGTCLEDIDGFSCDCEPGFRGDVCDQDFDECDYNPDLCGERAICVNIVGSYECRPCEPGYKRDRGGQMCIDVDECMNSSLCDGGKCVNTEGAFYCECFIGYKLSPDRTSCEDLVECDIVECGGTATCRNLPGSYECVCPNQGDFYDLEGKECVSPYIPEAIRKPCYPAPHTCRNPLSLNLTRDECCCTVGRSWGDCNSKESCPMMRTSSYNRLCPAGRGLARRGNFDMVDLDECTLFGNEKVCRNGRCANSFGGYECICFSGFYYNRRIQACDDINECRMRNKCIRGYCRNYRGSFKCRCPRGWVLRYDGFANTCTKLNGRRPNLFPYLPTAPKSELETTKSSVFEDWCYEKILQNYMCSEKLEKKHSYADCCCSLGVAWGPACSKCPNRYTDDYRFLCNRATSRISSPVRVAAANEDGNLEGFHEQDCSIVGGCENGKCLRTEHGYTCECNVGFVLDADLMVCTDVNECVELEKNKLCTNGICLNEPGSFRCLCRNNFKASPSDATICIPIEKDLEYLDDATNLSTERDV